MSLVKQCPGGRPVLTGDFRSVNCCETEFRKLYRVLGLESGVAKCLQNDGTTSSRDDAGTRFVGLSSAVATFRRVFWQDIPVATVWSF